MSPYIFTRDVVFAAFLVHRRPWRCQFVSYGYVLVVVVVAIVAILTSLMACLRLSLYTACLDAVALLRCDIVSLLPLVRLPGQR